MSLVPSGPAGLLANPQYVAYGAPMLDPRIRLAAQGASFAWKNRGAIKKTARAMRWKRQQRNTRKKNLNKVGEDVGQANAQRAMTVESGPTARSTRTLYAFNMTDIARQDDVSSAQGFNLDRRARDLINLIGFKVCFYVRNTNEKPVYMNLAILCPKDDQDVDTVDFFRSNKTGRSTDFDTSLSCLQFHCNPVNSDKYTILRHIRRTIHPSEEGGFNYMKPNWNLEDFWVPVNRQMRYKSNLPQSAINRIELVYWFDTTEAAGGSEALTMGTTNYHTVAYFKDTCTC